MKFGKLADVYIICQRSNRTILVLKLQNRKLWKFLGLTPENEYELLKYAADLIGGSVEMKQKLAGVFEIKNLR